MEAELLKLQEQRRKLVAESEELRSNLKESQSQHREASQLSEKSTQIEKEFNQFIAKLSSVLNCGQNRREILSKITMVSDNVVTMEADHVRQKAGFDDEKRKMKEKMGKMTALINKLRNQNKTYDAKQEKHLAQIKTLENGLESMQVEISRCLAQWRKFRRAESTTPRSKPDATLEQVVLDSVRQLSEKLLEAMDLCKQRDRKTKEMKQKYETQISELDGNRGKLKEKCQRLQKELDDRRASLQSAEKEAKTLRAAATDGWIPNLTAESLAKLEVLIRVQTPDSESERWCLVVVPTGEGKQMFWTSEDTLLSKTGCSAEDAYFLPELMSEQIEKRLKSKFDARWKSSTKKFDSNIKTLEFKLAEALSEKEKANDSQNKYKKRATKILENQQKEMENLKKEIDELKEINEKLKRSVIELEKKADTLQVEGLEEQLVTSQTRLRQIQSELELMKAKHEEAETNGLNLASQLRQKEETQEELIKKHQKSKEEMKKKFENKYHGLRDNARSIMQEKEEIIAQLKENLKSRPETPKQETTSPKVQSSQLSTSSSSTILDSDFDLAAHAKMQSMRHKDEDRIRKLQLLIKESQDKMTEKESQLEALQEKVKRYEQIDDLKIHADNTAYLKNAVQGYLLKKGDQNPLLQVIFQALNFTPEERQKILQHMEQEQSLLGWTGLSGLISGSDC